MVTSSTHLPKPKNWEDFERAMTVLAQEWLGDPHAEGNGRQGQSQAGVDVYGQRRKGHWVGIQCKKKYSNAVTETELREEVKKAAIFKPALSEFILATTAPRDANIQRVAREITDQRSDFSVHVWGWDTIEEKASEFARAIKQFDPAYHPYLGTEIANLLAVAHDIKVAVSGDLAPARSTAGPAAIDDLNNTTERHGKISIIQRLIDQNEISVAERQLSDLKAADWNEATGSERYRLLVAEANLAIKREQFRVAGEILLQAYEVCPEQENAEANRAVGLMLTDRADEAVKVATEVTRADANNQKAIDALVQARAAAGETDPFKGITEDKLNSPIAYALRSNLARLAGDKAWLQIASDGHAAHPDDKFLKRFAAEALLDRVLTLAPFYVIGENAEGINVEQVKEAATELSEQVSMLAQIGGSVPQSLAHNAALANRLIGATDRVLEALQLGQMSNPGDVELAEEFIAQECADGEPKAKIDRLETLPRSFNGGLMLASAYSEDGRFEDAEEILNASCSDPKDDAQTHNWLGVKLEWFLRQHRQADALAFFDTFRNENPDLVLGSVFLAKAARINGDRERAESLVEGTFETVDVKGNFLVLYELAEEAFRLEKFTIAFQILKDRVAVDRENDPLSLCVAAAVNGDLLREAADLLSTVPSVTKTDRWFQRVQIVLANRVGDPKTLGLLNSYISEHPNDAEMRCLRVAIWQGSGSEGKIKDDVAKANLDLLEGRPSVIMQYLRIAVMFGRPRDGLQGAYHLLLKNWQNQSCHLVFHSLFLSNDHLKSLDLFPTKISLDTVFFIINDEGTSEYRIEQICPPEFGDRWLSPADDIAEAAMGKHVDDELTFSVEGFKKKGKIGEIKSVYLDTFHRSISTFNERFPSSKALFQLEIDKDAEDPLGEVKEVLKQVSERDRQILDYYRNAPIPMAWLATMLGKDEIECAIGIPLQGINFKVCAGTHGERKSAIEAIEAFDGRGVVVDAITAIVVKRLGIYDAITKVCGPLKTPQTTLDLLAQRHFETSTKGLRSSGTLGWQNGALVLTEISDEQWGKIGQARSEELEWARDNLTVISALPKHELGEDARKTVEMVGAAAVAPVFAANGSDLPLLSEDFGLRIWADEIMGVRGAWLQPCLMVAKERGLIADEAYQKAINDMVDAGFDYLSLDVGCLVYAFRRAEFDAGKIGNQLKLLGGPRADLTTNLGVAARTLDAISGEACPRYKKLALASEIARQFTYPRWNEANAIIRVLLRLCNEQKVVLAEHLQEWLKWNSMGTP